MQIPIDDRIKLDHYMVPSSKNCCNIFFFKIRAIDILPSRDKFLHRDAPLSVELLSYTQRKGVWRGKEHLEQNYHYS
jgi:hypothetical protein